MTKTAEAWVELAAATPFLIGLIALFTLVIMIGLIANTQIIIKRLDEMLERLNKYDRKLEIEQEVRARLAERQKEDDTNTKTNIL